MHMNLLIREIDPEDKLFTTAVMRSQDVVKGLPYDMSFFIYLQERMVDELQQTYPGLKIGTYSHLSHSMHAYVRDAKVVESMIYGPMEIDHVQS